jgi:hypothetical protein
VHCIISFALHHTICIITEVSTHKCILILSNNVDTQNQLECILYNLVAIARFHWSLLDCYHLEAYIKLPSLDSPFNLSCCISPSNGKAFAALPLIDSTMSIITLASSTLIIHEPLGLSILNMIILVFDTMPYSLC